jgi:hypothetical protein
MHNFDTQYKIKLHIPVANKAHVVITVVTSTAAPGPTVKPPKAYRTNSTTAPLTVDHNTMMEDNH